ncbi:hypothetical protein FQN60_000160 [Etheostoma spectabile]|uniref:Ig-like domain-containing protein n=1 Tax=Etheostoma spectabile TaxID=54343 RepID=A0A5J5CYX6_9PERO|nr:hypothetical protein FQN60_000160 [Etheostoma spectabile]
MKQGNAERSVDSQTCNVDSKVSRVAWLNRTTILFAGSEKWSLDPRVILMENTAVTEYSIKIQNVDVHDEGPYVCSILTNKKPKSTKWKHLGCADMKSDGSWPPVTSTTSPSGRGIPARITNISKDIAVNEGNNVNLMCLAVGRPEANIIWKHHSPRGKGLELHNLWPDRTQQSTMIWLEATAALACSVALAPPRLKESQASSSVLPYGQRNLVLAAQWLSATSAVHDISKPSLIGSTQYLL